MLHYEMLEMIMKFDYIFEVFYPFLRVIILYIKYAK